MRGQGIFERLDWWAFANPGRMLIINLVLIALSWGGAIINLILLSKHLR